MEALTKPVEAMSFSRGQSFENRARERRALTHDADDLERRQASGQGVRIVEVVVEDGDGRPSRQRRPVRHLQAAF